jgi:hypothetical protein
MDLETTYKRRQSAALTESVMFVASGVGVLAAVIAFLQSGFYPAFALLLLSLIAFAQSRLFLLMESLISSVAQIERAGGPNTPGQDIEKRS